MNANVDEHHTRIVLKGWLKGLISICLLGAPVALGYLGIHLAIAHNGQVYSQEAQSLQQLRELGDSIAQIKRRAEANRHGSEFKLHYTHAIYRQADIDELIRKGQARALAGSNGYSGITRGHLYKHGRLVDPAAYTHRTAG